MKTIDALGKPCPIPVIEAKKALTDPVGDSVLIKVDNIVATQNLERMAKGYGYGFACAEIAKNSYEVTINRNGKNPPETKVTGGESDELNRSAATSGTVVVISRNTMGEGAEELGKILIKGFIYSLTELPMLPKYVIFLNSGAFLTSDGANTIDDLKKLEQDGVTILTCGTCLNYFSLQDKLEVGSICNMYEISEKMATATNIINI
jgi:selenium metabolism protein YedF